VWGWGGGGAGEGEAGICDHDEPERKKRKRTTGYWHLCKKSLTHQKRDMKEGRNFFEGRHRIICKNKKTSKEWMQERASEFRVWRGGNAQGLKVRRINHLAVSWGTDERGVYPLTGPGNGTSLSGYGSELKPPAQEGKQNPPHRNTFYIPIKPDFPR